MPHPGAAPGPADRAELRRLAGLMGSGRYHLDPDGIRTLAPDVWLIPGRGYVCLVQRTAAAAGLGGGAGRRPGIGGGCVTVRKALTDGIATGGPDGFLVAVPDDVSAIEARYRWHGPWKRIAAPGGLARLPGLGYQVRLAR
ncbi:hypothetical protein DSM104299_05188 [Baekduia alba]|uniref:hypothetical protein n=1 Tax=Baekduia alba TaxID=2997333 RepID=UPI0023404839|nr:hypothetical protein [Baekduia alba]WCB96429.1 hypothetical protein DSM104299_05188 [Baekduia alba]